MSVKDSENLTTILGQADLSTTLDINPSDTNLNGSEDPQIIRNYFQNKVISPLLAPEDKELVRLANSSKLDQAMDIFIALSQENKDIVLKIIEHDNIHDFDRLLEIINTPNATNKENEQNSSKLTEQEREIALAKLGITYNSIEDEYICDIEGFSLEITVPLQGMDTIIRIKSKTGKESKIVSLLQDAAIILPFNFQGKQTDLKQLGNLSRFIDQIKKLHSLNGDASVDIIESSFDAAVIFISEPEKLASANDFSSKDASLKIGIASLLIAVPETLDLFLKDSKYAAVKIWLESIGYLEIKSQNTEERQDFFRKKINGLLSNKQQAQLENLGITPSGEKGMKEFYREIETVSIDPDKAKLIFGTFDSLENKELKTLTLSNLLQILDKINNDQTLAEQSNRPVKEIIIKIYMNILRANLFLREGSLEDKRSLLSYLKRNQTLLKQYYNEGYWDTFRKLTTIDPTKLSIMENEFGLSDDNELKSKRDSLNIKLNEIYSSYVQNEEGITEGRMHPWSEIDKLEKFTTVREILSWINDKNITSELMKQPNKEHFDTVIDMAMLRLRKIMATSDLNLTIEQRNQILEKLFELAKNNNSIFSKQEIGNGDFFGIIELMLFQGLTQDVYSAIKLGLLNFTSNVDTGQDGRKGLTYKFIKFMLTKVDDIRRKEILNALNKAYSDATSNEIVEFVMQAISSNIKNLGSNLEADEKKALALLFFEALMLRDKLTPVTSISMEQKSELSNILGNPIFLWDSRLSDKRLGKYNSLALKHLLYNIG